MDGAAPETKALRDGRYVLLAPLGQGAQGTTWDAVDKREGHPVAIKAFDVRGARAWKDVELAEREARVLSELKHPLLPRYIEHFEADGVLYLVMEKVHGSSLSAVKTKGPRMNEKDVTRLLHDADQVLTYLHGRTPPVIHRDIKPSNVIRRTDGSFSFVDFGAVRDHLRPEGGSTVVGTFGYMAPEQFQGRAGPASDVYAVGATAIAMLTGQEPEKLPHKGLSLDVNAALGSHVSPLIREALTRMLDTNPDTRATRIGPLLEPRRSSRPAWDARRVRDSRAPEHVAIDAGMRSVRDFRRAARRAAKHAQRQARHDWRRSRPFRLPFPLRLIFGLGLTVAQVAVTLALRVAVPVVLTILSIVFGEGLRRAAKEVKLAGSQVSETLGEARAQVQRGWGPPDEEDEIRVRVKESADASGDPRVRVDAPAPKVRVATEEGDDEDEDFEDEPARRRRTRL